MPESLDVVAAPGSADTDGGNRACGPLAGLRVVDASTILAGPLCCRILGDFGADVVKVEHPRRGDSMRGHGPSKDGVPLWWQEISRNKATVGLSLSDPAGAEAFARLAATADVVVENFRPGTMERWGIGPDVLTAGNRRLVVVRITGFGPTGPYAHRPGFGTLAEAMSGFAHLTGEADGPPTLPAFGLADTLAGIAAANAATMALYRRDGGPGATGRGQVVDVDLLRPMLTAVGPSPMYFQQLGVVAQRHGNRSTNNAPRNTYRTADGRWVAVSTSAQAIAERVMRLVGHPEVVDEPWFATGAGRAAHVELLDGFVSKYLSRLTRDEAVAAFDAAEVALAPVYDAADIAGDPHMRSTGMLVEVESDRLGPVLQHGLLWGMSESPGAIRFPGRGLGADTDRVLGALGYAADELAELRGRGVVR